MRHGFTLVELLVTIGIIALLVGIAFPAVHYAMKSSRATRIAADLNSIAFGLQAYKQDFGDYPRPDPRNTSPARGAETLCRALLAPGQAGKLTDPTIRPGDDGADGLGFRTRRGVNSHHNGAYDSNGMPIMIFDNWLFQGKVYGPYVQNLDATATDGSGVIRGDASGVILYYVATRGDFDADDNSAYMPNAPHGKGAFALVSAGQDELFGTADDVVVQ